MNKKNLMDAFGEIDEELFAGADLSEFSSKNPEEAVAPVFIEGGKRRRSKRPFIYMGAGIAACAVLAVSLPMIANNAKPPYESAAVSEFSSQQYTDLTDFNEFTEPTESAESTEQVQQTEDSEPQEGTAAPPKEPPALQLFTKTKEILNAEDIYKIEKTQFDLTGFKENKGLWDIYANPIFKGTTLIDGSSFFYSTKGNAREYNQSEEEYLKEAYANIFLYNMDTDEHSLILTERSYNGENGLLYKPMNLVNGWLYYYRYEFIPAGDLEGQGSELWRINIDTKVKEKITDIKSDFYLTTVSMQAGVKAGKYLYFGDGYFSYKDEKPYTWLLRYDTEEGKLDYFKEPPYEIDTYPIAYDGGIIYSDKSGYYFHSNNGEPDKFLFDSDCRIEAIGEKSLLYIDGYYGEQRSMDYTEIGIIDENLERRELAVIPGVAYHTGAGTDKGMQIFTVGSPYFDEQVLIYDMEADCFSALDLAEGENAVLFTAEGAELKILIYKGETDQCESMTLYTIKKQNKIFIF